MRNVLIVFFIIAFVFLIIIFPFKTRLMGHLNLVDLKCYYSLKAWMLKLLCGKIESEDGKLKMTNEETLFSKTYDSEFVKIVGKEIISEIDIKKMEIFFTGGFKEDSFSSALMCASIISFVESFYGFLSLKYDNVKMYKDITPTFDENNLELTLDIVVSISLWRIVKCLLNAGKKVNKLKELKNEG